MNVAPLIKQSSLIYWSWILPYNLWYSAHDHAHRKYRAFGQSHWEEHGLSKASDTLRALMMTRYCLMITSNIEKHTQKLFLGYMFILFFFCFCFWQAKVQFNGRETYLSKTHFLTLVYIDPWTKNPLCPSWVSKQGVFCETPSWSFMFILFY